jgi:type IV secretion system protein VirB2
MNLSVLNMLRNLNSGAILLVAVILISTLFPGVAIAGEDIGEGGGLPYETGLQNLSDSMTGPVPFVISLLGIVGCGAMLIFGGEISGFMRTMVFIVLVVAVIVQAGSIVNLLKGTGTKPPDGRSAYVADMSMIVSTS